MSRFSAARTAAALFVAGGLVVGLSACGSDDSSSAKPSTVAKKEAGGKGVHLTVGNRDRESLTVTICADSTCRPEATLQPGTSTAMAADSVNGTVALASGSAVRFTAENPFIGLPSIGLDAGSGRVDFGLQEDSYRQTRVPGFEGVVTASRQADTDYKVLRLEVSR